MSIRDDAEALVRDGAWHSSVYHDFGSAWELAKAVAGLAREARKADDELLRRATEIINELRPTADMCALFVAWEESDARAATLLVALRERLKERP